MSLEIKLTSFGASMEEATLVRWLVAAGDSVSAGQAIAEVETDKALAELESPADGVIASIEVAGGSEGVEVGTVLARLVTDGEDEPAVEPSPRSEPADSVRAPVSPRVRRLAGELGIDLSKVIGSGPGGRILAEDLEGRTTGGETAMPETVEAAPAQAPAQADKEAGAAPEYELAPLTEMRRAIARHLTESARDVPQFSLFVDLDLESLLARRKSHNEKYPDEPRASINDYLVWACSRALMDTPDVNASWSEAGILRHRHANIAIAVSVKGGLVTPVIRAAETLSVAEIAAVAREFAEKARNKRLKNTDLDGGTFTVSNLGMAGIKSFTAILNPPQACILSVGTAEPRALVRNGAIVTGTIATVALTCDHRVVDGALGAAFLAALRRQIESL